MYGKQSPQLVNIPDALLTLRTVLALTGLSRATIYRLMARGEFPHPVHPLGPHTSRWIAADVRDWLVANGMDLPAANDDDVNGDLFDDKEFDS